MSGRGTTAIRVAGLRKRYRRRGPWALDDFEMEVPTGVITGVVGPNGAGKTTLFSVICGYLRPDAGDVDILGQGPFDPWSLKGRLGALPQDASLDDRLTCREFLLYVGRLHGLSRPAALADADRTLGELNLADRATDRIGTLSHGMRRRLASASALLGRPELVLLDEPTAGLDPAQSRDLRQLLLRMRGRSTLLVSSHNLDELERICDHLVLVDHGRCTRRGTVDEITGRGRHVAWELGPGQLPLDALREALPDHGFSWEPGADGGRLIQVPPPGTDLDAAAVEVARILAAATVAIRAVRRGRSLEESFLGEG
ncbi:MAG: ABC transporter ATP-binding protein [Myxococcota bacterium]|nr:ABC transporter ATP-binding protein [Myxococcota bacterium]